MAAQEPGFPARYYIHLCDALEKEGVDVSALLQSAGIPIDVYNSPSTLLTASQVDRLIGQAYDLTGRTDLAHDLGKALKLSSHGVLGFALLSSPTLEYALKLVSQYFSLILPAFSVRYRTAPQGAMVDCFPNSLLTDNCLRFHLELLATAFHWEVRDLLQEQMPDYEIFLTMPEPPHSQRFRQLREAHCHFGWQEQPGIRLRYPGQVMKRPLKLADSHALKEAEARCRELVGHAADNRKIGDWVEILLQESSGSMPGQEQIAGSLNMSTRTLDRYLRKEGLNFRELQKKVLIRKACKMLSESRLSITEIALELGYTDASNFARAFRKQAACSPQEWRENRSTAS